MSIFRPRLSVGVFFIAGIDVKREEYLRKYFWEANRNADLQLLRTLLFSFGRRHEQNFIRPVFDRQPAGGNQYSAGIPGGVACGYVVGVGGKVIYFAGDTSLFGDMKLIGERDKIDYAVLPIGGHYTMDSVDAAKAVELLGAENVIPVHYNTWDIIKQDPEDFAKLVTNAKVHIVKPGQSIELV